MKQLEGCHTKVRRSFLSVDVMSEFFFFYLFALTRINSTSMCVDLGRIGSYWLNIGVFWPEKGNRPVRKKNLKQKYWWILIQDSYYHCHKILVALIPFFFFFFFASSFSSSFFFLPPFVLFLFLIIFLLIVK